MTTATTADQVLRVLLWATVAGHVAVFVRLWLTGLYRTYRFFSYYLLFRAVRTTALNAVPWLVSGGTIPPYKTSTYGWIYLATEPLFWFFLVLVVLELYSLVLQDYKGLATFGRWVVVGGLMIAAVLFTVSLPTELGFTGNKSIILLPHFLAIYRGVMASLVVFLLVITGFLAWCPVPLCRNVVVHCVVYVVYFIGMALAGVAQLAAGTDWRLTLNVGLSSLSLACLMIWLFCLTPEGEKKTIRIRPRGTAQDEEALMAHLAAINSTLLRAARK